PASLFFQAEDGIRDLIVTGVQTCALPISRQFSIGHWSPPLNAGRDYGAIYPVVKLPLTSRWRSSQELTDPEVGVPDATVQLASTFLRREVAQRAGGQWRGSGARGEQGQAEGEADAAGRHGSSIAAERSALGDVSLQVVFYQAVAQRVPRDAKQLGGL